MSARAIRALPRSPWDRVGQRAACRSPSPSRAMRRSACAACSGVGVQRGTRSTVLVSPVSTTSRTRRGVRRPWRGSTWPTYERSWRMSTRPRRWPEDVDRAPGRVGECAQEAEQGALARRRWHRAAPSARRAVRSGDTSCRITIAVADEVDTVHAQDGRSGGGAGVGHRPACPARLTAASTACTDAARMEVSQPGAPARGPVHPALGVRDGGAAGSRAGGVLGVV